MSQQSAIQRIFRDYKELMSSESKFSIIPLDDDIMTWHGNLVPQYGRYQGFLIHYEIKFSENYPLIPPKVFLRVNIPHKNVFHGWDNNRENLSICLDLIKLFSLEGYKKVNRSSYLGGWSSSYSLLTILMQLESFLFQDEAEQDDGSIVNTYQNSNSAYWHGYGDLDQLIKHSPFYQSYRDCLKYECPQCGHTYDKPYPSLVSEIPPFRLRKEAIVPLINSNNHLTTEFLEWFEKEIDQTQESFQKTFLEIFPSNKQNQKEEEEEVASWGSLYHENYSENENQSEASIFDLIQATTKDEVINLLDDLNPPEDDPCHYYLYQNRKKIREFLNSLSEEERYKVVKKKDCCGELEWYLCSKHHQCLDCQISSHSWLLYLQSIGFKIEDPHRNDSKSAQDQNKNILEYLKIPLNYYFDRLKFLIDQDLLEINLETSLDNLIFELGYYPDLKKFDWDPRIKQLEKKFGKKIVNGSGNTLYGLPNHLKLNVMNILSDRSRAKLAKVSNILEMIANDPYIVERNQLKCYHSREQPNESILGYLVTPEYFNDSSKIKSIKFGLDLVSYNSYVEGLRKTAWGEISVFWLPVYLNKYKMCRTDDFELLLKSKIIELATSTRRISKLTQQCEDKTWYTEEEFQACKDPNGFDTDGKTKVYTFNQRMEYLKSKMDDPSLYFEEFVIMIMTNLMSSAVVEMMKGDIVVSNKALEGYCRWHRLFYYLIQKNPQIQVLIDQKIENFIKGGPRKRHKSVIPNLGQFLSYLCVSSKYSWKDIETDYLDECLKRNIYWILKKHLDWKLETVMSYLPYLEQIWEIVQVGKKLNLFYHYFVTQIAKPKGQSLDQVMDIYDAYYGFPSREIRDSFQVKIKNISETSSWKEFYAKLGIHYHGPKYLSKQLHRARRISDEIGYNDTLYPKKNNDQNQFDNYDSDSYF